MRKSRGAQPLPQPCWNMKILQSLNGIMNSVNFTQSLWLWHILLTKNTNLSVFENNRKLKKNNYYLIIWYFIYFNHFSWAWLLIINIDVYIFCFSNQYLHFDTSHKALLAFWFFFLYKPQLCTKKKSKCY